MASTVNVYHVSIAAGVLDLSAGSGIYVVDTENEDPTDTITDVSGAVHPHIYELRVEAAGRYWTINHNPAGNIYLMYGGSFTTINPRDKIFLRASETGNDVEELMRLVIPET